MPKKQQENTTEQELGFQLTAITTPQFALLKESFDVEGEIGLATQLRFAKDIANKRIGVFGQFTFEQSGDIILKIEVGCHFQIIEESWAHFCPDAETAEVTLPKGFAQHLAILTVGTTRGVLHARTEQTPYNVLILPTIDVGDLITEDVAIK